MKFAQIVDDKVHWIFESEEKPVFAPYIILIDITDREDIEEGWTYKDGEFTKPELAPKEVVKEPIDTEKIAMSEAIINLTMQLEELKLKIEGGK